MNKIRQFLHENPVLVIYSLAIIIGLMVLIYYFSPFRDKSKKFPKQLYVKRTKVLTAKAICSSKQFTGFNLCFRFPVDACLAVVNKEIDNCISYNIADLPEFISDKNIAIAKEWDLRISRCVGRASVNEIKKGKSITEIECMQKSLKQT